MEMDYSSKSKNESLLEEQLSSIFKVFFFWGGGGGGGVCQIKVITSLKKC